MGFYQRFFECPEAKEKMEFLTLIKMFEPSLFVRAEYCFDQSLKVPTRSALLDIYSQPTFGSDRDQTVLATMAHIKAGSNWFSVHFGKWLTMLRGHKRKLFIRTIDVMAENVAQCSATQCKPPLRGWVMEAPPTQALLFI